MSIAQRLYHALFASWERGPIEKCAPQKFGDRLLITDRRMMFDVPFEPVPIYCERVDGFFQWSDGSKRPRTIDYLQLMLQWRDEAAIELPVIQRPADAFGDAWEIKGVYENEEDEEEEDGDGDIHGAAFDYVAIQGVTFCAWNLWLIAQMPNARMTFIDDTLDRRLFCRPSSFVFDGGRGLVMPTGGNQ